MNSRRTGTSFGRQLKAQLGPRFDQLSADQLPGIKDLISKDPDALNKKSMELALRDLSSPESAASRAAFRNVAAVEAPNQLSKWNDVLDSLDGHTVETKLFPMLREENKRAYEQSKRSELEKIKTDAAVQKAQAKREDQAARELTKQAKSAEKAKGFYLDGYELSPEAAPSEKEARDIRAAQASTRTIRETIDEILGLYAKHGTETLPGPARSRMESLATDLQLAMKGPEQYSLGVLTGPDMAILESVAIKPTGAKASMLDFVSGDSNVLEKMAALRSQVDRRFENRAASMGYRRKKAPDVKAARQGAFQGEEQGAATVRVTDGIRTLEIPAADLKAAERDGWRRAQ